MNSPDFPTVVEGPHLIARSPFAGSERTGRHGRWAQLPRDSADRRNRRSVTVCSQRNSGRNALALAVCRATCRRCIRPQARRHNRQGPNQRAEKSIPDFWHGSNSAFRTQTPNNGRRNPSTPPESKSESPANAALSSEPCSSIPSPFEGEGEGVGEGC